MGRLNDEENIKPYMGEYKTPKDFYSIPRENWNGLFQSEQNEFKNYDEKLRNKIKRVSKNEDNFEEVKKRITLRSHIYDPDDEEEVKPTSKKRKN